MANIEAKPFALKPTRPKETLFGPNGSKIITEVKPVNTEVPVVLSHAALAEASHVIVAIAKNVGVKRAQAAVDTGETELEEMDDTVAAAHVHEGGAGFDIGVLRMRRANIREEAARADRIKSTYAEERHAIASRLARQGSATGAEMISDFRRVQTDKQLGKEVIVNVFIQTSDGQEMSLSSTGREKTANVLIPGEWVHPRQKKPEVSDYDAEVTDINKERKARRQVVDTTVIKPTTDDDSSHELRERRLVEVRASLEEAA